MLATGEEILTLIPQRQPMVMVDSLLEASETGATTQLTISNGNIFLEDNLFKEPGLVENIAQTAAAQIGYICRQKMVPVPIGYIAAIKDLNIKKLPPLKSTIITRITIKDVILDITRVEGIVMWQHEEVCRCEMRIFVKTQ